MTQTETKKNLSQSTGMSQNVQKRTYVGLIIKWSEDMPLYIYNMLIGERKKYIYIYIYTMYKWKIWVSKNSEGNGTGQDQLPNHLMNLSNHRAIKIVPSRSHREKVTRRADDTSRVRSSFTNRSWSMMWITPFVAPSSMWITLDDAPPK